jgi:hypothetical protein
VRRDALEGVPYSRKPGSFSIDAAMEKLQQSGAHR